MSTISDDYKSTKNLRSDVSDYFENFYNLFLLVRRTWRLHWLFVLINNSKMSLGFIF